MIRHRRNATIQQTGEHHETTIKYIAPALAAAAIGAAMALAPAANADTSPLVPYGANPHVPYVLGYHESNHDEADTTAGQLDLPF